MQSENKSQMDGESFLVASRRRVLQYATLLGVGTTSLVKSKSVRAAAADGKEAAGLAEPWPKMQYRMLGRTGHNSSRLIFGCGAALSRSPKDELLNKAFDSGVNTFDVGYKHYYGNAEKNMAPFLKTHRDKIFLISKAIVPADIEWDETINTQQAKRAAKGWLDLMEESLDEMQVDHVDAYYFMGANNVSIMKSDEMLAAFDQAKAAGKVSYLGVSTIRTPKTF